MRARWVAMAEEYLRCWNQTKAAIATGYPPGRARKSASRVFARPEVQAYIAERIAERAMTADEVLARLAEQARAEYAPYLLSSGTVDLERMLADGRGHLIKGIKWDRGGNRIVEFHDAQAALVHLGRHHKLFTDRTEEDVHVTLEGAREELERRIDQFMARRDAASVPAEPE